MIIPSPYSISCRFRADTIDKFFSQEWRRPPQNHLLENVYRRKISLATAW